MDVIAMRTYRGWTAVGEGVMFGVALYASLDLRLHRPSANALPAVCLIAREAYLADWLAETSAHQYTLPRENSPRGVPSEIRR